jgi:DNA-binding ferritin-like protein (Dps family)
MSALSKDLHERLRGRFNSLTMGRDDGAKTLVPDEAVFFEFGFKEGANDYGSVVVSILDEGSLKVYFKNDIVEEADEAAKDKWYDFLKDLRFFSAQNMLNYETKNITKSRLDKADFDFLVGKSNAKDNVAMESKLYGSSQRSYADLNGAKLIVQHNKTVDEEKMGSRSRNIRAIYIENSLGERFRFENNYLPGARAMARHISNGGYQNDEYGEHISEIMAEMSELKSFVRGVKKDDYVTEDSQEIIDLATDRYYGLKSTLESISKQRGYVDYFENYEPHEIEVDENDIDDLRTKLTREVFDDRLESSLGAVGRAMKLSEKKQGEFFDFGKWSRSANSAGAEIEGDVTGARAMKDGVEIGSWSQDAEDLEGPKMSSDIQEPGYGEINMGGGDRGEGDARTFELPASLELMSGTPSWKGMQFKDKNAMLAGILRDIADRAQDDEVSVFAADMATKVSSEGQSFGVRMSDEGYKDNKKLAVQLANMAIKQAQNESVEEVKAGRDQAELIAQNMEESADPYMAEYEQSMNGIVEKKEAKPDYLDFDGDGDKDEPMKKALADKKNMKEDEDYKGSAFGGTIDKMQYIVDTKSAMEIDGVLVDTFTASLIMDIFNKVNKDNQDKMRKMPVEKLASAAYKLADRVGEDVSEGYYDMPPMDRERYTDIPGMEGPFTTRSGKVVYYDPKEGKYYDRDSDMYLSYEEFKDYDQSRPEDFEITKMELPKKESAEAEVEVDEGRMSDLHIEITQMIDDGESDEDIMAAFPGLVSKQQLKSMRAEEMDGPAEYNESIDWLKKAAGLGSNTKSNFGIREGEQGYQKSLRDEIGKYLEGLK